MARTGIFKWDVKDARDELIREGKHPSIDAIRSALGDTGSKSTIHRFLKELEEEEAGSSQVAVSEALQGLVSQLAERLQHESQVEIEATTTRFNEERTALKSSITAATLLAESRAAELERVRSELTFEKAEHDGTMATLRGAQTEIVRLTEQAKAYEQRLAEQVSHQKSLEDKHEQARQALEHFRTAAKDQRDQEQRRHEQQVQQLQMEIRELNASLGEKLSQLSQINRDAAALSTENNGLRSQLHESRAERDRLEKELVRVRDVASQGEGQRMALEARLHEVKTSLAERMSADAQRTRELELTGARSEVQLAQAHDQVMSLQRELAQLGKLTRAAGIVRASEALIDATSDDIKRLETLRTKALGVFESAEGADLWIHQQNPGLGKVAPITLINSDAGLARAVDVLVRIEHARAP